MINVAQNNLLLVCMHIIAVVLRLIVLHEFALSNDMTYWVFTHCSLHFVVKIQTTTTGKPHNLIPDLYSNLLPQDFIYYSVLSCFSMIFLQHDVISLKEDPLRSNYNTLFLC
jgi:hypothetical protein